MNTQTVEKLQTFTCDQCKRNMSIVQEGPYREMQVENVEANKVSLKQRIRKMWRAISWHWNFGRVYQWPRWIWTVVIGLVVLAGGSVFSYQMLRFTIGLLLCVGGISGIAFLLWLSGYLIIRYVMTNQTVWDEEEKSDCMAIGLCACLAIPAFVYVMWLIGSMIVK